MAIKIVTDSTSDLPAQLAKELGVTVVPLNVHFGDETYRDGLDIDSEQFFDWVTSGPIFPKTSQPSVGAFLEVYSNLLKGDDQIISIHASSKLSGTVNSALQAREQSGLSDRITVVDSMQVGIGLGVVVAAVANDMRSGNSKEELVERAHRYADKARVYLLVETLEYLQRGGRIGKAQAFLGSILHVRPILSLQNGEVHPLEKVRTRKKGIDRLYELASAHGSFQHMAVCSSTTVDDAIQLEQSLTPFLADGAKSFQTRFGPVVGTHVGPDAVGIAVLDS